MKTAGAIAWLGSGLVASLLCACATPPKNDPAPAKPVADTALGLSGANFTAAGPTWWDDFGDGQLDHLIQQAISDSPTLAQAQARLREAQAQASEARSGELPSVKLSASEARVRLPSSLPASIGGGNSTWFGDAGASLAWDLDLWGAHEDEAKQADVLARAAGLDIENARLLLEGAIVQSYIDLYHSYALEDIAHRAEDQRINILDITRKRVVAGLDTRVEQREAEGAVPQARVALAQAQSSEQMAIHQLAALTGHGADGYASVARPQLKLDSAVPLPTELPMNLLARRPDVIAARMRIQAADLQKRAAKAEFYPKVNLSALAGFVSFGLKDMIGSKAFGYDAGPGISLPLFDGGLLRGQYQATEAQLDQAVSGYDDTVVRAVRQAADQISLINYVSAELDQQRQSLDAAEDAYRLAEERYRAGLAGYLTVLNVETEVLNERRQQADLTASLASARVSLLLAVGGSFQSPDAPNVAAR